MLNVEFARAWAAALRSGKYPQGRRWLRTADGEFCPLGVACDLLIARGLLPPWTLDDAWYGIESPTACGSSIAHAVLPIAAVEHVGLEHDMGWTDVAVGGETYWSLAAANDRGRTFAEIADAIDAKADEVEREIGRNRQWLREHYLGPEAGNRWVFVGETYVATVSGEGVA